MLKIDFKPIENDSFIPTQIALSEPCGCTHSSMRQASSTHNDHQLLSWAWIHSWGLSPPSLLWVYPWQFVPLMDGKPSLRQRYTLKSYYALHLMSVAMTSPKFDKNILSLWLIYNDADWPIAKCRLGVGFTATIAGMGTLDTQSRRGYQAVQLMLFSGHQLVIC